MHANIPPVLLQLSITPEERCNQDHCPNRNVILHGGEISLYPRAKGAVISQIAATAKIDGRYFICFTSFMKWTNKLYY